MDSWKLVVPGDTSRGCQEIGPWPQGCCLGQMVTNSGGTVLPNFSQARKVIGNSRHSLQGPARFVTYMVRITNTDKPALSTNASNTKRPRFYLSACLSIFVRFPNRMSGFSSVHFLVRQSPCENRRTKRLSRTANFEASSLLGRSFFFGKLQLISVRISFLFMLWP